MIPSTQEQTNKLEENSDQINPQYFQNFSHTSDFQIFRPVLPKPPWQPKVCSGLNNLADCRQKYKTMFTRKQNISFFVKKAKPDKFFP